jgi:hypothetical protein
MKGSIEFTDNELNQIRAEMLAGVDAAIAECGGDKKRALGVLTLRGARIMAVELGLPEAMLIQCALNCAPGKREADYLAEAIRMARGGH